MTDSRMFKYVFYTIVILFVLGAIWTGIDNYKIQKLTNECDDYMHYTYNFTDYISDPKINHIDGLSICKATIPTGCTMGIKFKKAQNLTGHYNSIYANCTNIVQVRVNMERIMPRINTME